MLERIKEERRLTHRLMSYWNFLRGERHFPQQGEIDTDALKELDLWDHVFLIQSKETCETGKVTFAFIGQGAMKVYGDDLEADSPVRYAAKAVRKDVRALMVAKHPLTTSSQFINKSNLLVRYRQCMVPFSDDDHHIDMIMGVIRSRTFP